MNSAFDKANHICLLILASFAVAMALYFTREVLVPFAFAILLYEALLPLQKWLEDKTKMPEFYSDIVIFVLFLLLLLGIFVFLISSVGDFINLVDFYRAKFDQWGNQLLGLLAEQGVSVDRQKLQAFAKDLPILGTLRSFAGNVFSFIGNLSLVALFVGFLVFGSRKGIPDGHLLSDVNAAVSTYLATKFVASLTTAILVGLILWSFGSDLVLVLAFLTFLLNFIPSIGSVFATLLPIPILALKLGFGGPILICLLLLGSTQFIIGNILEPKFMGQNLSLHPIAIMIFLLFWGVVWGIPGMFLSVPITAAVKIIFSKLDSTKPLALLMEGRLA